MSIIQRQIEVRWPLRVFFTENIFALENRTLRDALAAKGVDPQQMIDTGLLVHGEGITVPYDRFQNRVMFPIHDRGGRVVAFGGRAMDPGAKAKYLKSMEIEDQNRQLKKLKTMKMQNLKKEIVLFKKN